MRRYSMNAPTLSLVETYRRLAVSTLCPVERAILEARGLLATRYFMRANGSPNATLFGRPVTFNGVSR